MRLVLAVKRLVYWYIVNMKIANFLYLLCTANCC